MAFSSPFALSQLACRPLNNLESPYPAAAAAASRFPLLRPALRRYRFRSHLTSPKSRLPNPQSETVTSTAVTLNLLDHVRKPLTAALFCLAVALLPIPFLRAPAIAAPAATVYPSKKSGKTSISYTTEHEFSHYTRRLLEEAVSVLLQRIEEVKSNNGEMRSVKEALKQVKMRRMEIQKEVMGNLNAELRVLWAEKAELMRRSGAVVDAATTAQKERDKLLKDGGEDGEVKEKLESLERRITDADLEYGDIWDRIGDIEDKIARRETMTLSIAIRELSFIEKESEVLVERFRLEQRNKFESQLESSYSRLSRDDVQRDLETAQREYWVQILLPKVVEADDSETFLDNNTQTFALNIRNALKESRQRQGDLEANLRKKFKRFGDEKCLLVNTPPEEVVKGYPELELKWLFGTKEVIVPKAIRLHLFNGWKRWREETKTKLKRDLIENADQGRHYMARRQDRILLDRERVMNKTWYNDERTRWEMDTVAVPYAVSKKLIESARIRHDWGVMYVTLKGDDKEYYVDLKEFELLFEDFGGFDGLYMKMLASGIPTAVQIMWIPFSDLNIDQQFRLILSLLKQCLIGFWEFSVVSNARQWVYTKIINTTDDLMVMIAFPLVELILPKKLRMKLGMAWPEEVYQAVGSTWYLKWQSEAELNHRARKRDNIPWYFWFLVRSFVYGYVVYNVLDYLKRKIPRLLGYGPLRRNPNLRKLRRVKAYIQFKLRRKIRRKKEGVDPIRSAFDQMRRVKNPPIRLDDFASVDSMREEINDIVTCLQNPTAFQEKGARAPRGVLIVGERGTGKTSLALAIAAEAKVPMVEVKARQLEAGLWVGQSASNVREGVSVRREKEKQCSSGYRRKMAANASPPSPLLLLSFLILLPLAQCGVTYDRKALIINGQRRILISGSIHYPRSTPEMWEGLVQKAKDGGLDVVETYIFWNGHEPSPGSYNFEGRYDLVRFIKTVQKAGLYVHIRIGPYVCAEWNFGGFPVWLKYVPGISFRTDNEPFKAAMQGFTEKIVRMMKSEGLYESQGGPIILSQIENEYGPESKAFGPAGHAYITWAAEMAAGLGTGVPWVMCKEDDAPDPMINTCNGFYCDSFTPNKPYKPTIWTEAWSGWFTEFGGTVRQRPVEDLAYSVARFIQSGGSFINYYMYHGGTNFGRTAGGPFITTSYDYDAPIDEYGLIREPKYGHLKELHKAIKLCERALVSADPTVTSLGSYQQAHVFTSHSGDCAAFLSNNNPDSFAKVTFNNMHYSLPPWSISILPDCRNVVFNTAKVGVQTSQMQMSPTNAQSLMWEKYDEEVASLGANPLITTTGLLEQINVTRDASDYLWYITSTDVSSNEGFLKRGQVPVLIVQSAGHALHVFINGQLSGSAYGTRENKRIKYSVNVNLRAGTNKIALLSVAMGLPNVGVHYELWNTGVLGPVVLQGLDEGNRDLTWQRWSYQVGLKGEAMNLNSLDGSSSVGWMTWPLTVQEQQPLTWFRAYFDAPAGDEPLALDMGSMGKGQVWINGQSIGRYWTAYAPNGDCGGCNYAGTYRPPKCQSGCGQPTQRWYHVPHSWLQPTKNLLVVFEEIGGDATKISLVQRSVSGVCADVSEGHPMIKNWHIDSYGQPEEHRRPKVHLRCAPGQSISAIKFASFGTPLGTCGNFQQGTCHSPDSHTILEKKCIGQQVCAVTISVTNFGGDPCPNVLKRVAVEAVCTSVNQPIS